MSCLMSGCAAPGTAGTARGTRSRPGPARGGNERSFGLLAAPSVPGLSIPALWERLPETFPRPGRGRCRPRCALGRARGKLRRLWGSWAVPAPRGHSRHPGEVPGLDLPDPRWIPSGSGGASTAAGTELRDKFLPAALLLPKSRVLVTKSASEPLFPRFPASSRILFNPSVPGVSLAVPGSPLGVPWRLCPSSVLSLPCPGSAIFVFFPAQIPSLFPTLPPATLGEAPGMRRSLPVPPWPEPGAAPGPEEPQGQPCPGGLSCRRCSRDIPGLLPGPCAVSPHGRGSDSVSPAPRRWPSSSCRSREPHSRALSVPWRCRWGGRAGGGLGRGPC